MTQNTSTGGTVTRFPVGTITMYRKVGKVVVIDHDPVGAYIVRFLTGPKKYKQGLHRVWLSDSKKESRAVEDATATRNTNVVAINGGEVHAPNPCCDTPFPLCRTGGQTNRGTRYTSTDAPVTCKSCGPDRPEVAR